MPTTCREKLRTCSACQTIYEIASTTNPPMKARKNSFASVWRKSKAAVPALQAPSSRILKQNLRHTAGHLILVESPKANLMATSTRIAPLDHAVARPLHIEQVEDLLKLQKAAQKITSILDLDQLIDQIVNDVARSFGCIEANLYLHDEANAEVVLAGVHGCTLHDKGQRLKVGKEGMVGYVAATGQMRYAPDVRKDQYYIAC